MLRAIRLIQEAKVLNGRPHDQVIADVHPSRPDYRGMIIPDGPTVSLEADPSFDEMQAAGAVVKRNGDAHTILDGMFLASGEIPRVTPYEIGLKYGARFDCTTKIWRADSLILDERLLMVNIKGTRGPCFTKDSPLISIQVKVLSCLPAVATPVS